MQNGRHATSTRCTNYYMTWYVKLMFICSCTHALLSDNPNLQSEWEGYAPYEIFWVGCTYTYAWCMLVCIVTGNADMERKYDVTGNPLDEGRSRIRGCNYLFARKPSMLVCIVCVCVLKSSGSDSQLTGSWILVHKDYMGHHWLAAILFAAIYVNFAFVYTCLQF